MLAALRSEHREKNQTASAQSGRASGTEPDEFACVLHSTTICALCFVSIWLAATSTGDCLLAQLGFVVEARGGRSAEREEDAQCNCDLLFHVSESQSGFLGAGAL